MPNFVKSDDFDEVCADIYHQYVGLRQKLTPTNFVSSAHDATVRVRPAMLRLTLWAFIPTFIVGADFAASAKSGLKRGCLYWVPFF